MLPIMESFLTLQGEGFWQGRKAHFVRTAGCDVGCVWCDVKESWGVQQDQHRSIDSIIEEVKESDTDIAVITGGEPTMYDLAGITEGLRAQGVRTHIETSGVYPLSGQWDWVCLSPKKFKPTTDDIHQRADELKVIVYNKSDFKFALEHAARVRPDCKLYLQPEWGRVNQMVPLIVDFIKEHKGWGMSLQTHKYMNIP